MRIAIIGGGLSGLSTANFMIRLGHQVQLFERSQSFSPTVGAGFSLHPNGQLVLNQLGLTEQLKPLLNPLLFVETRKLNGEVLGSSEIDSVAGFQLSGCKRSELVNLLADTLPSNTLFHGKTFKSLEQNKASNIITMEDGSTYQADIVIGADGIRSRVRSFLHSVAPVEPRFAGIEVYYGTIHDSITEGVHKELESLLPSFPTDRAVQILGDGKLFLTFCVGKKRPSRIWAYVSKTTKQPKSETWNTEGEKQELIDQTFPHFTSDVSQLIELTSHIQHFGICDREPVKPWFEGRNVLVGDACHATLPTAGGQGVNQALEDSFVLTQAMRRHGNDIETAFKEYQDSRFERASKIVRLGVQTANFELHTNPILEWGRDFLIGQFYKRNVLNRIQASMMSECPVPLDQEEFYI